jgi:hypothetical protein
MGRSQRLSCDNFVCVDGERVYTSCSYVLFGVGMSFPRVPATPYKTQSDVVKLLLYLAKTSEICLRAHFGPGPLVVRCYTNYPHRGARQRRTLQSDSAFNSQLRNLSDSIRLLMLLLERSKELIRWVLVHRTG